MLEIYSSVVIVAVLVLFFIMTFHVFYTASGAASKMDQGSTTDTGIFPKRSRNINAWYLSNASDTSTGAYPILFPQTPFGVSTAYHPNEPARIGLVKTTNCPIFRAQDNGSTDPLLIG